MQYEVMAYKLHFVRRGRRETRRPLQSNDLWVIFCLVSGTRRSQVPVSIRVKSGANRDRICGNYQANLQENASLNSPVFSYDIIYKDMMLFLLGIIYDDNNQSN